MTIAWAFPGQGSQKLGMADEILSLSGAKERFGLASEILGRDLLEICQGISNGSEDLSDLNDTRNTQPALFLVESILVDHLKKQKQKPDYVAGHSLGEFVALYAAEVLSLETSLALLKTRSELMASVEGGKMTAVLGFERSELNNLIVDTQGVVIANDNSSDQVVLSGTASAVNFVSSNLKCRRVVPLNVSGAFHSPFMQDAANIFSKELDAVQFTEGIYPVLSNVDPTPSTNSSTLKERLKSQMITGVRWRETMNFMDKNGIENFVEIGPGKVLSGLVKRSIKGIKITQISSSGDLVN